MNSAAQITRLAFRPFRKVLLGLVIGWNLGHPAFAQTPILYYNFNAGTGTTATSSGSDAAVTMMNNSAGAATNLYGAAGSGVTGAAGDFALNLTTATGMGGNGSLNTGGALELTSAPLGGLTSFTVSGWFDPTTEIVSAARFFDYTGGSNNGFLVDASANGQMGLTVNNQVAGTTGTVFASSNTWMFFAITYDGTSTSSNVNFYEGTLTSGPILVSTASSSLGAIVGVSNGNLFIGNAASYQRPLKAELDDFALYGTSSGSGGALTSAQVNSLYVSEVPEPSALGLGLLGGLMLLLVGRRRGARL